MDGFSSSCAFPLTENAGASSSSSVPSPAGVLDDGFEDCCSICLESFTSHDPATVTSCRHEYHLQCILDWSQRSKECPICWQLFVLRDPASQELLHALQCGRSDNTSNLSTSMLTNLQLHTSADFDKDTSYLDDTDFDETMLHHQNAFARRVRLDCQRERPWSPSCFSPQQSESPRRPSLSETFSPDTLKSKFSAVSARYKESISKGTRGLKEKILARNTSVKELGRGVQREMNAGIAGVARMIERLDITPKHREPFKIVSNNAGAKPNLLIRGKDAQQIIIPQDMRKRSGQFSCDERSAVLVLDSNSSGRFELSGIQGGH